MIQPRPLLPFAACALAAAALSLQTTPAKAAAQPPTLQSLRRDFLNPPNAARPMVRWWWFGPAVVKSELLTELQQMKVDGIQGAEIAFVYPEVLDDPAGGLKNLAFLSPEMLDDVRYTQAQARRLGLRIDVTLCSGWPYGGPHITTGQSVTALHIFEISVPANATSAQLPPAIPKPTPAEINATPPDPPAKPAAGPKKPIFYEGDSILSAVIADPAAPAPPSERPGRGGRAGGGPRPAAFNPATAAPIPVNGLTATFLASDHPRIAVFFVQGHTDQQVKRAAVDADGPVLDPFSHDAVATHLAIVGEPLLKAFGPTPPYAIFSDSLEAYGADWTPNLPAEFRNRRGYDLIPHLPELVAGGTPAADQVRHDYGQTLTELIDQNYLKQMADWATIHHTKFRSQTYGDPAVDFSSQNIPQLAEGEGPLWRAFSTLRWATSANHVFNHVVTSGETFTWLHSPVFRATPLDMKTEADIDFIMGENQIVCHGWPYSPPGDEVPEPGWSLYAAGSFNNHNPWHPVMPAVTAYIGRMSLLMRQGKPANQVVILLPTDDVWAGFSPTHTTVTGALGPHISPLMPPILSAGYNVDYIDAKAVSKIGLGTHQIVVLPPTDRIPLDALRKLAAWSKSGGHVIAVGHAPTMTPDGKSPPELASLTASFVVVATADMLPHALHAAATPDLTLAEGQDSMKDQIGFIRRKLPNADIYFVANTSNLPLDTTATFATRYKGGEAWDPDSAAIALASAGNQPIHLAPYESRVFIFSDSPTHPGAPHLDSEMWASTIPPASPLVDLSSDWQVNFVSTSRTLTESTPTDWTADPATLHYSGEAVYSRDFDIPALATGRIDLEVEGGKPLPGSPNTIVEQPPVLGPDGLPNPLITRPAPRNFGYYDAPIREAALVAINGHPAGALWHPPYRLDVSKYLKPGTNHIEIHVFNTALNAWSALPPHDYKPLIAKYGDRFQMQDLNQVKPISSGLLGKVSLISAEAP